MKKIFLLLSINSIFIPSLYTISCKSKIVWGNPAPNINKFVIKNYPINRYNTPTEERNFLNFLKRTNKNYGNEVLIEDQNIVTYKDPETIKTKIINQHLIHIKEIEDFNFETYKFELSLYTSQKNRKFKFIESKEFEVSMIYDISEKEPSSFLKQKKWEAKDFIDNGIKEITYKKFYDFFQSALMHFAEEFFLKKYQTDFNVLNTVVDKIGLWNMYGSEIQGEESESIMKITNDDYFYISELEFKETNLENQKIWGKIWFYEYPGEPETPETPEPKVIDVSDVIIEDIKSYRQSVILLFLFDLERLPSDINKIVSDSIKEQKQISRANINWSDSQNIIMSFEKGGEQYFFSKEDMQAYFDSGETEIELYLSINEKNNDPELRGDFWININCDRK
ncbi:hypothetical protein [Spiroplasma endosymbiont of Cantharis rufa]|uniref:hypothetical protein n=1 Tax=Spiroplasma endosymbiont of Cantharis rufa TaxID=3066279 RepID=UPI0030CCEFB3